MFSARCSPLTARRSPLAAHRSQDSNPGSGSKKIMNKYGLSVSP